MNNYGHFLEWLFFNFPMFFTTSTSKNFTVWCLSLLYMYYETYSISQIKFIENMATAHTENQEFCALLY